MLSSQFGASGDQSPNLGRCRLTQLEPNEAHRADRDWILPYSLKERVGHKVDGYQPAQTEGQVVRNLEVADGAERNLADRERWPVLVQRRAAHGFR